MNTDNESRDGHLKKAEYFDVASPTRPFVLKAPRLFSHLLPAGLYFGGVTIKGVTKPVEFRFSARPRWRIHFEGEFRD
ncbi:MAG: YceI family protein [Chitinophagaceae bacterium]|nr:YceI family protein [Chitinophagaceae bacterium]